MTSRGSRQDSNSVSCCGEAESTLVAGSYRRSMSAIASVKANESLGISMF